MNFELKKATFDDKELLWNLLQFALYDGSFYVDNKIDENGLFEYSWYNNYFTDDDRFAYLIRSENLILGFALVNSNLKLSHDCNAQTIAEFLILPQYRKNHIGKKVAYQIFDMFEGEWEVQPMENNIGAYLFWRKVIKEYSNNKYETYHFEDQEDVFVFNTNKK